MVRVSVLGERLFPRDIKEELRSGNILQIILQRGVLWKFIILDVYF